MSKGMKFAATLAIAACAITAGTFGGMAISNAVITPPAPLTHENQSIHPVDKYPTNEAGQTYGFIDQGLISDDQQRPQLVMVTTDDGEDGFAYYLELFPNAGVESPLEAEASNHPESYSVPVYEVDGKTQIGFHTLNRPPEMQSD